MAFKFVVLAALVAVANAGVISGPLTYAAQPAVQYASAPVAYAAPATYAAAPVGYAQPIAKAVVAKTIDADFDPNPQYSYAYDVQDGLTGDSKTQQETRNGDSVQGSYSLVEADGTRRIVEYTADSVNGFNAVVHKEPAQVAVKAVAAAPVVKAVHAPIYTAQPAVQYTQYSAPVAAVKTLAQAPVAYAAPAHYGYAAAPVAHAKISAPLQYSAPALYH